MANQGNQVATQEHFYDFLGKCLKMLLKRKNHRPQMASLVLKAHDTKPRF